MAKKRTRTTSRKNVATTDDAVTLDSFQNFSLNLGLGTDNALTGSTYGFNPITRIRTLLEWIYRGTWMGAMAVDLVADDMTRAGVEIQDDNLTPDQITDIQTEAVRLGVWTGVNDNTKWARLYGGAIGVMLIDGQDMFTPLREDTIRPGQFKGIMSFDRWQVTPSSLLVQQMGPDMGTPLFYTIGDDAPALRGQRVHYTRVIRQVGVKLPWNQTIAENLWGLSVIERIYDRMIAFDSATQGAAQLVYRSYIRTYKIKGMRKLLGMGGKDGEALQILLKYTEMVRKFASMEGMTLIDAEDELTGEQVNVQSGISDALVQFGQQLSGALQIPLVRLFGQSPAGLNATGESDLRTYYDNINNQQNKELYRPLLTVFRLIAANKGIKVDQNFNIKFASLWQMTEPQKSEVAERDARSIADLEGAGIYDKPTALRDLRQVGRITGRFQNVTDELIKAAEAEPAPEVTGLLEQVGGGLPGGDNPDSKLGERDFGKKDGDNDNKPDRRAKAKTADGADLWPMRDYMDLQLVIETNKGETRSGPGWQVKMPADYGFIRGTSSAEGKYEQMDVFVGPHQSSTAYIVDSADAMGEFDEHKIMLGFRNQFDAIMCYALAYHDSRVPMNVTPVSIDGLKAWLAAGQFDGPYAAPVVALRAVK